MYQLVVIAATLAAALAFLRTRSRYLGRLLLVYLGASCMALVDTVLAAVKGEQAFEYTLDSLALGVTLVAAALLIAWVLPMRSGTQSR